VNECRRAATYKMLVRRLGVRLRLHIIEAETLGRKIKALTNDILVTMLHVRCEWKLISLVRPPTLQIPCWYWSLAARHEQFHSRALIGLLYCSRLNVALPSGGGSLMQD
jgi:hypothetical protein